MRTDINSVSHEGIAGKPQKLRVGDSLQPGDVISTHKRFHAVVIPLAVLTDPKLSAGAKLMYGALSLVAGRDGRCNPSIERMAERFAIPEGTVKRQLAELVDEGWIVREKGGRGHSANCYFLWNDSLRGCLRDADNGSKVSLQDIEIESQKRDSKHVVRPHRVSELDRIEVSKMGRAYKEAKKIQFEKSSDFEEEEEEDGPVSITEAGPELLTEAELQEERRLFQEAGSRGRWAVQGFMELPTELHCRGWLTQLKAFADTGDCHDKGVRYEAEVYLWFLPKRHSDFIRGYQFFAGDIRKHWPEFRKEAFRAYEDHLTESRKPNPHEAFEAKKQAQLNERKQEAKEQAERLQAIAAKCQAKGYAAILDPAPVELLFDLLGGSSIGAEAYRYSTCTTCAGCGKNPETENYCSCATGQEKRVLDSRCPRCFNTGIRPVDPEEPFGISEWCTCGEGEKKRSQRPNLVDTQNRVAKSGKTSIPPPRAVSCQRHEVAA